MTVRHKKYEKGSVVSVMGFTPPRQEGDLWVPVPHSSSEIDEGDLYTINIPVGVNAMLVQALDQNIRYTLSPGAPPSATSGFRLTAGNDPLVIPISPITSQLIFTSEADGAMLEFQFGVI
jgi:hypothetical protein